MKECEDPGPPHQIKLYRWGAVGPGPAAVHPAVESAAVSAVAGRAGVSLGLDVCEVRLCDPCARVRPCVPCVSRLPPVSFYRYCDSCVYPVCVPARPRPVF